MDIVIFRDNLKKRNISEGKAVKFLTPHLMKDYKTIGEKINELFNQ